MRSTFFGLEIGRSALMTHQQALEVTGQNLANANTAGYSRQNVEIASTDPFSYPGFNRTNAPGQMGTGVNVQAILRIRDELLDQRIQVETSALGRWESRRDSLEQMEQVINEPADSNVRTSVDAFWQSLQDLSTFPNERSVRSAVREQAITMCDTLKQTYTQLKTIRDNTNDRVIKVVDEINDLAKQIAKLNDQIGKITPLGQNPNDLMDKRGVLIEKLSKMVNIEQYSDKKGWISITVGGRQLVSGDEAVEIVTDATTDDNGMVKLLWTDVNHQVTDKEVKVMSGSLKGLLEIRDRDLPDLINNLDTFSSTIIAKMNELHRQGYGMQGTTGIDFFKGTKASDIYISDEIAEDLNQIAASKENPGLDTGTPGNGEIALAMAEVKHQLIFSSNTSTMGDFLAGVVSQLGVNAQTAKSGAENYDLLVINLDTRRESISGVSYDEEMTNIVRFQHGYDAAAKIISTMDEMLEVIINKLKI